MQSKNEFSHRKFQFFWGEKNLLILHKYAQNMLTEKLPRQSLLESEYRYLTWLLSWAKVSNIDSENPQSIETKSISITNFWRLSDCFIVHFTAMETLCITIYNECFCLM